MIHDLLALLPLLGYAAAFVVLVTAAWSAPDPA
jgi:hypothetical protein